VGKKGFKNLAVWQKAKDLAVLIYRVSNSEMKNVDFGLRDQVRRSAVSVASNLAEGDERDTDKESVRYFFIAKGSVAELRTQLQIAHESGHLNGTMYETLKKNTPLWAKESASSFRRDAHPLASSPLPLACP